MPRHLRFDDNHLGYIFMTDSRKEGMEYGMITNSFDQQIEQFKMPLDLQSVVVLGINTKHIRKEIILDPEYESNKDFFVKKGTWEHVKEMFSSGLWYKYKGNIPLKDIMLLDKYLVKEQPEIVQKTLEQFATIRFASEYAEQFMENLKKK